MNIELVAIGQVRSSRQEKGDDDWDRETACVELTAAFTAEAFAGLEDFSHVEVFFYMHQVEPSKIETGSRHPRNQVNWPKVGVFAQRGKNRPNRLGATICRIVRREGTTLFVSGLDAIDGTPVVDVKPVFKEFLPRGDLRQPTWADDIMRGYW